MKVKIKKLDPSAKIPQYAKDGDAGLDFTAVSKKYDEQGNVVYGLGIAIEIPKGYVGLIFPRSSVSKVSITLTNSVGVVDSGYRGEVMVKFKPLPQYTSGPGNTTDYEIGDKVCQMIIIPYPSIELEEVEELSDSERGSGGYGSTGK